MTSSPLRTIALGAALLSPAALGAQATCRDIPDFDIFLRQHAPVRQRIEASPEVNKEGTPLTIWFRYDTTQASRFELLTNPPGGTVIKGPAYLTDEGNGTMFTNNDLGNKRVIDTATVQFRNCLRDVILRGEPVAPTPRAPKPEPEPAPPQPAPAPVTNITNNITINKTQIIIDQTPEKVVADTTPPPIVVREPYTPRGLLGVYFGPLTYSGSKNTGIDYRNEFPLDTKKRSSGLQFQALFPVTTTAQDSSAYVNAVLAAQRFGANGLHVELTNPQGGHVAREDSDFSFTEVSATWHALRRAAIGLRGTYDRGARQLVEIAVETPARPGFTSVNPTVTNAYTLLEAVLGPAHLNVSAGYAHQSLSDDPLTDGGNGWTAQVQYDGRLHPQKSIPFMLRARHSSVRGKEIETPNGRAPFEGSRTTLQAQLAPIALVSGLQNDFEEVPWWQHILQIGILRVHHTYKAGSEHPETFTFGYIGGVFPFPNLNRHERTPEENP
jgi:hypothetical protein